MKSDEGEAWPGAQPGAEGAGRRCGQQISPHDHPCHVRWGAGSVGWGDPGDPRSFESSTRSRKTPTPSCGPPAKRGTLLPQPKRVPPTHPPQTSSTAEAAPGQRGPGVSRETLGCWRDVLPLLTPLQHHPSPGKHFPCHRQDLCQAIRHNDSSLRKVGETPAKQGRHWGSFPHNLNAFGFELCLGVRLRPALSRTPFWFRWQPLAAWWSGEAQSQVPGLLSHAPPQLCSGDSP